MASVYRLYISARMTGQPDNGAGPLNDAAFKLRRAGYAACNPVELDGEEPSDDWGLCIIRDLSWLRKCDGICLLSGWELSPGARIEYEFARRLGMHTGDLGYWLSMTGEYLAP